MPDERLAARNPQIQRLRRLLGRRSARAEEGAFVVEGPKLVLELLGSTLRVEAVYLESRDAAIAAAAEARGVPVRLVQPEVIERIGSTVTPQPALAVAGLPEGSRAATLATARGALVLVLAGVSDPGNAGTLLRCAEAAGAGAVVFAGAAAVDPFHPKVARASAGSLFRVPVVAVPAVRDALAAVGAAGFRRVGTRSGSDPAYDEVDLTGGVALVLGNEAHGLDADVTELVDEWVAIPMAGDVESLNVAMAGTVLAFESARQRRR